MKLIKQIKPGILISLNVAGREYPHSHKLIMTFLKKEINYRDLSRIMVALNIKSRKNNKIHQHSLIP